MPEHTYANVYIEQKTKQNIQLEVDLVFINSLHVVFINGFHVVDIFRI